MLFAVLVALRRREASSWPHSTPQQTVALFVVSNGRRHTSHVFAIRRRCVGVLRGYLPSAR
jgi:hypothetical protein